MMSIGLIEELSQRPKDMTAVTYFFCQSADYELNTMEAIIKGLILQLMRQQGSVKQALRDRWDPVLKQFTEDVSSWRGLWNVFMEMLERCTCPRVYVVVDALDECRDAGMADLLKLIVRTGLSQPSRIKWLLTSRPLDSAERELLVGSEQVRVSLELNTEHIAQGVRRYISYKVAELDRRGGYGSVLRHEVEQELARKAEDTFLWVSLVCKRLETVRGEEALATIHDLPLGLNDLYHQMLTQLCHGELTMVESCVRLLQVLMQAYRPLHVREVSSVTGLPDDLGYVEALADRSASFVKQRGMYIEFVHQSTRDYLAGTNGRSVLEAHDQYGHGEMAVSCLTHLQQRLKVNLLDLPRPDATRPTRETMSTGDSELLISLHYAATFWFQHVDMAKDHTIVQEILAPNEQVEKLLYTRLLEWLECLSLLDQLPRAVEGLKVLANTVAETQYVSPNFLLLQWSISYTKTHLVSATVASAGVRAGCDAVLTATLSDRVDVAAAGVQFGGCV